MKLVDLFVVNDVFATGLGRVDILPGGFARLVLYVERKAADGTKENVVIDQIVMPIGSALEAIGVAAEALAGGAPDEDEDRYPVPTIRAH